MKVVLKRAYDSAADSRCKVTLMLDGMSYELPVTRIVQGNHNTVKVAGLPTINWFDPTITTDLSTSDSGMTFRVMSNQREAALSTQTLQFTGRVDLVNDAVTTTVDVSDSWNGKTLQSYKYSRQFSSSDFRSEVSGSMLNVKLVTSDTILASYQLPNVTGHENAPTFINSDVVTAHLQSPGDQLRFDWPGYSSGHEVVLDVTSLGGPVPLASTTSSQKIRLMSDESGANIRIIYADADQNIAFVDTTDSALNVSGSAVSKLGWGDLDL